MTIRAAAAGRARMSIFGGGKGRKREAREMVRVNVGGGLKCVVGIEFGECDRRL